MPSILLRPRRKLSTRWNALCCYLSIGARQCRTTRASSRDAESRRVVMLLLVPLALLALCESSTDAERLDRRPALERRKGGARDASDDDPVVTSVAVVQPAPPPPPPSAAAEHGAARTARSRRDIFHLYNMMSCTTHCDPLSYKGYGCYCGFLGSGRAVDSIDSCCRKHDDCYGNTPCRHQSLIYFVPYKWKCNGGHPYCVVPHGATKASDRCAHHLCECDRQFAECIRRFPCPVKKTTCPSNPFRSLG